jgi:hypothetical protein
MLLTQRIREYDIWQIWALDLDNNNNKMRKYKIFFYC